MKQTLTIVSLALITLLHLSCDPKADEARTDVPLYTIEQFYANKQIGGGAFSPDETRLLVSNNESGIYNVYEITVADASMRQVTSSTVESFFAIDYVPGGTDILYTADKGGNENNHIYFLTEDGTTKDLTPGENEKAAFTGWSIDKGSLYYISNRRDPKFFDLYKMDVRNWKPELLYENDAGYNIDGISWDENYIALNKSITTSENQLFLYSRGKGSMTEISDSSMPGSYYSTGFSRDNRSFHYITDAGKEFLYLVRYDLPTGERKTLYETDWDVMYSYTSENEKYRVIAVNTDGTNTLKIIDNSTGQDVDFPAIPDGDVQAVSISDSEEMMRLTVGTSKAPSNIYVYNFGTKELKKLTNTLNPEIDPGNLVSAEVVRFPSFDDLRIPAIFYRPLTASSSSRVPALVWVHGGPGGQSRVGYSALIQYLVNHGYAILAVNNRGSSGYGKSFFKMDDRNHGDKDLRDCIYGKKYLQSLPYVDSGNIGILGGSYGGFMTMAAMTFAPEEFAVGVNLFGVTNWLRTLTSVPPYWESFRKALYAEMGDPFTEDSTRLYNISPLFHADRIRHPVMVLQGANDVRVLQVESDEIVAAMKKNNVPVEYIVFPDEGHGFRKKENQIRGYGSVLEFLDKYLKGTGNPRS